MGLLDTIKKIATEVQDVTKFMIDEGYDLTYVSELEQKLRIGLCTRCPKFKPLTRQCGICKCFMDFKTKLLFDPIESTRQKKKIKTVCPIDKW